MFIILFLRLIVELVFTVAPHSIGSTTRGSKIIFRIFRSNVSCRLSIFLGVFTGRIQVMCNQIFDFFPRRFHKPSIYFSNQSKHPFSDYSLPFVSVSNPRFVLDVRNVLLVLTHDVSHFDKLTLVNRSIVMR